MVDSFNVVLKMFGTSLEEVVDQASEDYDKLTERLDQIQSEIEKGPFKGYLRVEISPAGFVVVNSTVSDLRWDNRVRAYPDSWVRIDDLCHECWLYHKFMKGELKYAMDSEV